MSQITALAVAVYVALSTAALADIQRFSQNPSLQQQASMIEMSIEIDAAVAEVWNLVGKHFDKSKVFNVEAVSTFYLEGTTPQVGSRRRTIGTDGTFIDVQIFRFSHRDHTVSWEITNTDLAPLSFGFSEYRLENIGAKRTRLVQTSGFKMESGLMNAAMRFRFPTILKTELAGIKFFIETGNQITPRTARKVRLKYGDAINVRRSW
ncbi:MAG: SRPBCC family protein [Paracoccaceae bacterium]|nr:SRPBCC family protein [Paracoccaceae bacterium]